MSIIKITRVSQTLSANKYGCVPVWECRDIYMPVSQSQLASHFMSVFLILKIPIWSSSNIPPYPLFNCWMLKIYYVELLTKTCDQTESIVQLPTLNVLSQWLWNIWLKKTEDCYNINVCYAGLYKSVDLNDFVRILPSDHWFFKDNIMLVKIPIIAISSIQWKCDISNVWLFVQTTTVHL